MRLEKLIWIIVYVGSVYAAYCVGGTLREARMMEAYSDRLYELQQEYGQHERQVAWRVVGVVGQAFELRCGSSSLLFRFEDCTIADDALGNLQDLDLCEGWLVVPERIAESEKGKVVVGRAVVRGVDLRDELVERGVLLSGEIR